MEMKEILQNGLTKIATLIGVEIKNVNDVNLDNFSKLVNDINNQLTQYELKNKRDQERKNIQEAIQLLEENNIKKLYICEFGTYTQNELAGDKIWSEPFECCYEEYIECFYVENLGLSEDLYNKLKNLLYFINTDYIYNLLKFDDTGQNLLMLTKDGFSYEKFWR